MPKIGDWYMMKKIDVDGLITHTISRETVNEACDRMREGGSIRNVVVC